MRIEQLTFTRFIAAILIVIFHFGGSCNLFNNKYFLFILEELNIAVSYFYILSGFVMIIAYNNLEKIDLLKYIKNRIARIYPVYFLALFLTILSSNFYNTNILDLFLNLFMIQSWFPEKAMTINPPSWSLSVEFFFYLCFSFLFNRLYTKLKFSTNVIWIVLFWMISQIIFHLITYRIIQIPYFSIKDFHYFPILHFNEFLIGNLTGLYFIREMKNQNNYLPHIITVIIILLLILKFQIGFNFHNGLLAIIFAPLIFFISSSNDKFTVFLTNKKFIFLGEISFGIYILQAPIWMIFSDYRMEKYFGLNKNLNFTSSFFIRLSILIVFSTISYLYFEKPLKKILIKIVSRVNLHNYLFLFLRKISNSNRTSISTK